MSNSTENNNQEKSISEAVLKTIESGAAKQSPKWHFMLRGVLWAAVSVLAFICLLFVVSLAAFTISENKIMAARDFGWLGASTMLVSLPWILFGIIAILIFVVEYLARRYSFAYRRPLLYSIAAILIIVFGGSMLLSQLRFHENMQEYSGARRSPVAFVYQGDMGRPIIKLHTGIIERFNPDGFLMRSRFDEILSVIINERTSFPRGKTFVEQDPVLVIGPRQDTVIYAQGIRCLK